MTLNDAKQEWKKSLVDDDIITLNVRELQESECYEYLLYSLSKDERRNDGRLKDKWIKSYNFLKEGGWWCSGIDILSNQDSEWGCLKPYSPRKNHKAKPIKYEHPVNVPTEIFALKTPQSLWQQIAEIYKTPIKDETNIWEWIANNPSVPLVLTEGAKKTGFLLSLNLPAIGLPGINSGYRNENGYLALIPQLEKLVVEGREIIFVFDQDKKFTTRQNINNVIKIYHKILKKLGCGVSVVAWDSANGKGCDDFAKNCGKESFLEKFHYRLPFDQWLTTNSQKARKLTFDQLFNFVETEISEDLAFDTLRSKVLYQGEELIFDEDIRAWFYNNFNYLANKDDIQETIIYFAKKNSFNPVRKYLENCYNTAQRIPIDNIATRYLGVADPIYDLMVKKWLVSAVARGIKPGTKVDHALVLQGATGIYKSQFFNSLGKEFYDASATEKLYDKDTKLIIHSCWIQEFAEYERLNKRGQEEVKHWFTLEKDNFRKPYGRVSQDFLRPCIFGATANKAEFLMDETSDRRTWVIPVNHLNLPGGKIDYQLLDQERDSIWASAVDCYFAYLKGDESQKWWVDRDEEELISQSNERFRDWDEWQDAILNWIEAYGLEQFTTRELLEKCFNLPITDQDKSAQMRVGKILTRLGWIRKKLGNTRGWFMPVGATSSKVAPKVAPGCNADCDSDSEVEPSTRGHLDQKVAPKVAPGCNADCDSDSENQGPPGPPFLQNSTFLETAKKYMGDYSIGQAVEYRTDRHGWLKSSIKRVATVGDGYVRFELQNGMIVKSDSSFFRPYNHSESNDQT